MDKVSPQLALAASDGTAFDTVIIELCRAAGEEKVTFFYDQLFWAVIGVVNTGYFGLAQKACAQPFGSGRFGWS